MTLIGERPIGGKLEMLKNNLKNIANQEARTLANEFWGMANQTKTMRNRCFHGVWGFSVSRGEKVTAGAAHFKEVENPVRADQLPELEKRLCKTARIGWNALTGINDFANASQGCVRLFHGKGDTPAWLPEWRAQHPLDDHALDHRHKSGQLPYLTKPL